MRDAAPDHAASDGANPVADYKRILGERHGVVFNHLHTLANMPIQRFGSTLLSKGQFSGYMQLLRGAHQDANLDSVMCRSLISVVPSLLARTLRGRPSWLQAQ